MGGHWGEHEDWSGSYKPYSSSKAGMQSKQGTSASKAGMQSKQSASSTDNQINQNNNTSSSTGNTSTNTTTNNNQGFVNDNKNNTSAGNELSILDQISEDNAKTDEAKRLLKIAEDKQNKKKKIWGLDKWSNDNLNGGSVDTSDGVVDDVINLKDAADKMMELLGLDPTKKKSMQIALNYLSNDQWGSQTKLKNSRNAAAIDKLVGEGPDGKWKTWGTRLRGDAAWKGRGPMDKDKYTRELTRTTAKVEPGSMAYKYQRALINSMKPLKSKGGLGKLIGTFLFPGLSAATSGKGSQIVDWLNSHNEAGEIGVDENGIFNFEMYGEEMNINGTKDFDDFGIDFKDYIIEEKDTQDNEIGGNYKTYSFDNTGVVTDDEEDEDETQQTSLTVYDDDNPAWWDLGLFTEFFSGRRA